MVVEKALALLNPVTSQLSVRLFIDANDVTKSGRKDFYVISLRVDGQEVRRFTVNPESIRLILNVFITFELYVLFYLRNYLSKKFSLLNYYKSNRFKEYVFIVYLHANWVFFSFFLTSNKQPLRFEVLLSVFWII